MTNLNNMKHPWYKRFLILILLIPGTGLFAQNGKKITLYSDKGNNFFVEAVKFNEIITGNCSAPMTVQITTKGVCPGNLVLNWRVSFYDCNSKEQTMPFKVSINKGRTNFSYSQPLKVKKIISVIADVVQSRFVEPPSNFEIAGDEQILEGDKATLRISTGQQTSGIKWTWYKKGSVNPIGEGPSIVVDPPNTSTYYARSNLEGFQSISKSFTVNVKMKPEPPKNWSIRGKETILEGDETELSIELDNAPYGLKWSWYTEGNNSPFAHGQRITISPERTTKYLVQADLNGKKSPIKAYTVNVKITPEPPDNFTISGPDVIKEGEKVVLKIVSTVRPEGIKWLWYKANEPISFNEGDSVTVVADETINYKVKAALFNKRSTAKSFTLNVIVSSRLPDITGNLKVCTGLQQKGKYSISGGRLGTGSSTWEWYEGKCGSGKLIGRGKEIDILLPELTKNYYVIPDSDREICKTFMIEVFRAAQLPEKIILPDFICSNKPFVLKIEGGKLNDNKKWVWYSQDASAGSSKKKIGEGSTITVISTTSAYYFVRAEGGNCKPSDEVSAFIRIDDPLLRNAYISSVYLSEKKVKLRAANIPSSTVYKVRWYKGSCGNNKIGSGNSVDVKINKKLTSYYMRAEGLCDTLNCSKISLARQKSSNKTSYFFINTGVVSDGGNDFTNGMITVGSKRIYLRAKFSISDLTGPVYQQYNYTSSAEYIYDNSGISNYPATNTTYQTPNGDVNNIRLAGTLGVMLGNRALKYYIGAGYGVRDLKWGFNVYRRTNMAFVESIWAKNTLESMKGTELESGLFIKLGGFNLMVGGSILYSPEMNKQIIDYHAGIGFSFNKK